MEAKQTTKKPKKRAAAIKYDPETDALPTMTAFGEGYVAEKTIEKGKQSGLPVITDAELVSLLAGMNVGDEIPPSLYEVVAKILVFVAEIDSSYGEKLKKASEN
ncbi:MAG: flagellar biogenesis protein [Clostridiales bacterium]|jgi:flagellar biosynthesis protein|nr:flagellar biogenesis protein [Clostridiales bacterium]